jgi:hypothetical protein
MGRQTSARTYSAGQREKRVWPSIRGADADGAAQRCAARARYPGRHVLRQAMFSDPGQAVQPRCDREPRNRYRTEPDSECTR